MFTNAAIVELAGQLVPVKVDCDKQEGLRKKYNITSYPTLMFVDAKGKVMGKIRGAPQAEYLADKMRQFIKVSSQLTELQSRFETDPSDLESGGLLAAVYANAGNEPQARRYIRTVEKTDPDNKQGHLTDAYLAMGDYYAEQEKFSSAVKYYEQAYSTAKDPLEISEARYNGAIAYFESRKGLSDKSRNFEKRLVSAKEQLDLLLEMQGITADRRQEAETLRATVNQEIAAYKERRGD